MADLRRVKLMRGNESTRTTVIPEQGEQISTIDELKVYLGDGVKSGGYVINADNTITTCLDQANVSTKHSLAWWIAWFNGSDATIRIPKGTHDILTNMTIPSNICLEFDKGAFFNIASGVTLTVNSDIDAGIWEVYTGDGTVDGTAYHPTRPEMPTPEYTDDSDRIATTAFVKDVLSTDPALDGIPTAPTADPDTNTTQIATTAYADAKVADSITEDVTTIAPSQNAVFDAFGIESWSTIAPILTGIPEAPTASVGTNTTQIATTAFVKDVFSNSPALDGTPTAPTAVLGTNNTQIANTSYVKTEINAVLAASDALIFKGTLGTGGTITTLPTSDYLIGWTYKVITAGTYAGNACEVGDMIVSIVDFDTVSNDSDWVVIQTNLDGIVIGPATAIDAHIAIFDGITGKLIKDSGFTIETSVPADALFTDTVYTHPESGVVADTYTSVTVDVNGHVTGGTNPTTLSEYGITDAATSESPTLTGTPTAPTAVAGTNSTQIATTEFVKSEIDSVLAVADVLTFKGTIGVGGTVTSLPSSDYKIGWTYKVITAGTYSGYACEIGDMITCVVDFNITPNNSDWTVIQSNLDGAVIGPASAINNHISVFNGITGKLIKDSGFTIETSVPSGALFTDTVYTHPTSGVSAGTYKSVTVNENGHVTTGTNPTTLSGYGITDAANLNSPALTGIPTAPTASLGTNTTQIATTAFVNDNITNFVNSGFNSSSKTFISTDLQVDFNIADIYVDNYFSFSVYRNGVLQSLGIDYTLDTTTDNEKITMVENCDADEIIIVMFNSNTTHVPTAPTASPETNNNQIATTAYADAKVADVINDGVTTIAPSQNAVFDALALKADITDTNALSLVVADNQLRLSDHDNLLRGYNPTGAERVDIDSTARSVSLPINVAEGGLNVLQGGMTLTNLITNGDFSDGTTGWTRFYGIIAVVDNICEYSVVTPNGSARIEKINGIPSFTAGHKYFVKYSIKATINTTATVYLGDGWTVTQAIVANVWYSYIAIKTVTSNAELGFYCNTTAMSVGDKVYYKDVELIDLTTHGLASLTASQADALVAAGYFEGTKSATATRIKVVDADSGNPTYQYVEPIVLRRLADGTRDTIENGTHIQRVSDNGTEALATPVITYGVATGVPIAYPNGTITLEPVLADVGYYTDKFEISRTGYPVVSLETLSIVDLATGQLTPLDISTAVIAGDGLSFTHADLTAGDLVDVTYVWGYDGVYGENTFGYLDSNIVKINNTLALKADAGDVTASLALKADVTAVTAGLLLKADITSLEIEKKLLMDEIDSLKKSAIENSNAPYLTVSDYGDVVLAKNSVGVGTVGVDGVTVENLVVNGDFSVASYTGWSRWNSTNAVVNGVLVNTGSGGALEPDTRYSNLIVAQSGDKIYIKVKVRALNSDCTQIWTHLHNGGTFVSDLVSQSNPVLNTWYTLAKIYTVGKSISDVVLRVRHTYASAATALGKSIEIEEVHIINLTAYGLASLTDAQVADLLPVYFDGTKTFGGVGCLISKDADSNEVGRQYFSTTPMYSNATAKDTLTYSGGKYYHTHNVDSDGNAIAEPYDTEVETNGQFLALSEGTVTYEPWYPDIAVYTDKFTLTKAITAVKELYKYGSETPITDAVIAGDGLSFTSASLTAGDLVYGVFEFDEPLRPLMTIKSRNDDATVVDTVTGTVYTFRPVITNGAIASWALTEV